MGFWLLGFQTCQVGFTGAVTEVPLFPVLIMTENAFYMLETPLLKRKNGFKGRPTQVLVHKSHAKDVDVEHIDKNIMRSRPAELLELN